METTEIPLVVLSDDDYIELRRISDLKLNVLRGALYSIIGGSHGRAGEWTMEKIRLSKQWSRGEMVAHVFQHYLQMKPNE